MYPCLEEKEDANPLQHCLLPVPSWDPIVSRQISPELQRLEAKEGENHIALVVLPCFVPYQPISDHEILLCRVFGCVCCAKLSEGLCL